MRYFWCVCGARNYRCLVLIQLMSLMQTVEIFLDLLCSHVEIYFILFWFCTDHFLHKALKVLYHDAEFCFGYQSAADCGP
jgi:hypothetical protein